MRIKPLSHLGKRDEDGMDCQIAGYSGLYHIWLAFVWGIRAVEVPEYRT
jgi:hypothetical protein